MPEGHTVHRTAIEFRKNFVGQSVHVSSPQGRFEQSAALISGQTLTAAKAVGKQLFLSFGSENQLRIHLGIYGKWRFEDYGLFAPEPVGQVRARFATQTRFADLRGPTACELLSPEAAFAAMAQLGPDPLAAGASALVDEFSAKVLKSQAAIGQLLMNQNVIAGVGNVYRAELLFRAGVSPFIPGKQMTESKLNEMWSDAVLLLNLGVKQGVMVTRKELLGKRPPVKAERNYVYKREGMPCRVCGDLVKIQLMAARKLYWCGTCQV